MRAHLEQRAEAGNGKPWLTLDYSSQDTPNPPPYPTRPAAVLTLISARFRNSTGLRSQQTQCCARSTPSASTLDTHPMSLQVTQENVGIVGVRVFIG